ncbi:hypothetical protein L596_011135 [Steinernema carpocapsae]|uniref:Uncharacterized protein n=1 Tax=Steinernema carpocapsae TaxID=34508 RepID=A0A4U5NTV5_STECR|nr:hypothetical protein L596_011135 [Steinernema carpocapsae]
MSLAPQLAMAAIGGQLTTSTAHNYRASDGFTRMEGPIRTTSILDPTASLTGSLRQSGVIDPVNALRASEIHTNETAAEMSLNALYLYSLRSRKIGIERSAVASNYGSFRGPGTDLFSVPDRSALFDAMQSTSGVQQHQRSHMVGSIAEEQGEEDLEGPPESFPTA